MNFSFELVTFHPLREIKVGFKNVFTLFREISNFVVAGGRPDPLLSAPDVIVVVVIVIIVVVVIVIVFVIVVVVVVGVDVVAGHRICRNVAPGGGKRRG